MSPTMVSFSSRAGSPPCNDGSTDVVASSKSLGDAAIAHTPSAESRKPRKRPSIPRPAVFFSSRGGSPPRSDDTSDEKSPSTVYAANGSGKADRPSILKKSTSEQPVDSSSDAAESGPPVLRVANLAKSRIGAVRTLRAAHFELRHIVTGGFTPSELLAAGYNTRALKAEGTFGCTELKQAGISMEELHSIGFDTEALLSAGFSRSEVDALISE